jgi:hypothetical protein
MNNNMGEIIMNMKGLKKNKFIPAFLSLSAGLLAAMSGSVNAELTMLEDKDLSQVSGRAGLTIDLETKWSVEEVAYQDAGYFLFQDLRLGGSESAEELAFSGGHGFLDNLRLDVDIAGSGSTPNDNLIEHGFSSMVTFAKAHTDNNNLDADMLLAAGITTGLAEDANTGLLIDTKKAYGDGDLVVHIWATDAWQKGGGFDAYNNGSNGNDGGGNFNASLTSLSYGAARDVALHAIDFNYSIDILGLADSAYEVGSSGMEAYLNTTSGRINGTNHSTGFDPTANTTALISGLSIDGYLGPIDFHIENNGNGFGDDGSSHTGLPGTGNANSKIVTDIFFEITDLDVYIDIAGVQYSDIQIHNRRGDLTSMNRNALDTDFTSSFGFGHAKRSMYAVRDNVLSYEGAIAGTNSMVDGMALNLEFKGDFDIGGLSFGDTGQSIGSIYVTDIELTRNWVISAH